MFEEENQNLSYSEDTNKLKIIDQNLDKIPSIKIEEHNENIFKRITILEEPCKISSSSAEFNLENKNLVPCEGSNILNQIQIDNIIEPKSDMNDRLPDTSELCIKIDKDDNTLKDGIGCLRSQIAELGPKFSFLNEHFDYFLKIKQEYEITKTQKKLENCLKTNKVNKYVQTWQTTVMCNSCAKTLAYQQQMQKEYPKDEETIFVTKSEMLKLEESLRNFRKELAKRENDYENRAEKAQIVHLTALNSKYRSQILDLQSADRLSQRQMKLLLDTIEKLTGQKSTNIIAKEDDKFLPEFSANNIINSKNLRQTSSSMTLDTESSSGLDIQTNDWNSHQDTDSLWSKLTNEY